MKDPGKKLLALLAEKPDLIAEFPEWMLPEKMLKQIGNTPHVAIAEIAGRDSIAAVIRACEMRAIRAIVPTIAYTGTEYGNWKTPLEKTNKLKALLKKKRVAVFKPVILGSPKFWRFLCGRYVTHLFNKYGFFSHCIGCHLYLHAIRIPLAKKLGSSLVIGGERESHDGRIKLNQIGVALDAYRKFMNGFNIELLLPLRHIKSGGEIESIIGSEWDEGDQQLECVLSKNYREMDESVAFNEDTVKLFLDEFALKKAKEIIKGYLE